MKKTQAGLDPNYERELDRGTSSQRYNPQHKVDDNGQRIARTFKYDALDDSVRDVVLLRTREIKARYQRAAKDFFEIGKKLTEVKALLPHGAYTPWLEQEFAWDERTARRFTNVYDRFKTDNLSVLNIGKSVLYLLTESATPPEAANEILSRARNGEKVTLSTAQSIVSSFKSTESDVSIEQRRADDANLPPLEVGDPVETKDGTGKIAEIKTLPNGIKSYTVRLMPQNRPQSGYFRGQFEAAAHPPTGGLPAITGTSEPPKPPVRLTNGDAHEPHIDDVPSIQLEPSTNGHSPSIEARPGVSHDAAARFTLPISINGSAYNYKRDIKTSRPTDTSEAKGYDTCQTPPYAIDALLPYLDPSWRIWEPACGEGLMVEAFYDAGFEVVGTDIVTGQNFFNYELEQWDALITNPPYSIKFDWWERCYALGKPFALLLPFESLSTKTAQSFMEQYGDFTIMLLDERVDFKMPNAGWEGAGAQYPVVWFCWRLMPEQVLFGKISAGKQAWKAQLKAQLEAEALS